MKGGEGMSQKSHMPDTQTRTQCCDGLGMGAVGGAGWRRAKVGDGDICKSVTVKLKKRENGMHSDKVCQSICGPGPKHGDSFIKQRCYLKSELTIDKV